jgi:hypothetical protein
MNLGFIKLKEIDQIIISYLDLSDYVTLLKTNKKFKELFIISDLIHKDKIFEFLKYLVEIKDINFSIEIVNELQCNSDCISKYNLEDFANNPDVFFELIIMGGIENEESLYNFAENYIIDYVYDLYNQMETLYDIICYEYPLNTFIKKLFYFAKSHLAKRVIKTIISCFNDNNHLYTYYTFMFENDEYFNSLVVERYIKIIPDTNWCFFTKHITECLIHNISYKCNNDIKLNYINQFLKAAENLKSIELLDIVEYMMKINLIKDIHKSNKFKELIENTRKMILM